MHPIFNNHGIEHLIIGWIISIKNNNKVEKWKHIIKKIKNKRIVTKIKINKRHNQILMNLIMKLQSHHKTTYHHKQTYNGRTYPQNNVFYVINN